jgi:hypothetical protein
VLRSSILPDGGGWSAGELVGEVVTRGLLKPEAVLNGVLNELMK